VQRSRVIAPVVLSVAVLLVPSLGGCSSDPVRQSTTTQSTAPTAQSTTTQSTNGTAPATQSGTTASTEPASDPAADGFSVTALLAATPEVDGTVLISAADVEGATQDAGLERPLDTGAAFLTWLTDSTGVEQGAAVAIPWPNSLGVQYAAQHQDFVEAVGFGIPQVDAFLEVSAPPTRVALLDGRFDPAAVSAAIGEPVDGVWAQDGEELATDLEHRLAPDELGRPVRVVGDQERMLITLETDVAAAYGSGEVGGWADLQPVAEALDALDVYGAQLWRSDDDGTVVAVGLVLTDGASEPVVVHQYAAAAEAEQAAAKLEGLADGPVTVDEVDVEGPLLTARLGWEADTPPALAWQLLAKRSPVLG
jgi:hypothetical protein